MSAPLHDWSTGWPSDRLAAGERICERCRLRMRPSPRWMTDVGPAYSGDGGRTWSPELYRECGAPVGEVAA